MSFKAGAICKFNCCQNSIDLPEDNKRVWSSEERRWNYSCGCPFHYFLIISSSPYNNQIHKNYSSEPPKECKLCVALPLDSEQDILKKEAYTSIKQLWINLNTQDDIVEANIRNKEDKKEFEWLRSLGKSSVICHNICKINVNSKKTDTLGYILPEKFGEIIEKLNLLFERSRKELDQNYLIK